MGDQKKVQGAKARARKAAVVKAAPKAADSTVSEIAPNVPAQAEAKPVARRSAARKAGRAKAAAAPLFDAAAPAPLAAAPLAASLAGAAIPANSSAETMIAPAARLLEAGADQARQAYARAQATGESLRHAITETATATTQCALEVNSKMLDALRAQSDVAVDLWRSTLTAGSLSEAIHVQASGARHAYETATMHWKDIAATTTRWLGATVKPIQSAWTSQSR